MSHISKAKINVNYTDTNLLKEALSHYGLVVENERLYRVGVGYTSERYQIVLISHSDSDKRFGFNFENGLWIQYQEDYGSYGMWTKQTSNHVQDHYMALQYQINLKEQGFNCAITKLNGGGVQLEAVEAIW